MAAQPIPTRAAGPLVNASMPLSSSYRGAQVPSYPVPPGTPAVPIGTGAFGPPAPPPITAPDIAPYRPPTSNPLPGAFTGTGPTPTPVGAFTGTAPTATPYGDFTAPDPTKVADSPYFQFRLSQGLKGIERGAAARGTLLTGGLQSRLQEFGSGLASEEASKDYQRALASYETNRGTNAQNFGQARDVFEAGRSGYLTNRDTNAQNFGQARDAYRDTLDAYRTNADVGTANYDRASDDARFTYANAADDAMRRNEVSNANTAANYQAQLDAYARQQQEAKQAQAVPPLRRGGFRKSGAFA